MKVLTFSLLLSLFLSQSQSLTLDSLVQSSAQSSAQTASADSSAWKKYREARGEHDCLIDEAKNWLGSQRCAYSWECRGARQCQKGTFEKGDGWCTGTSACPEMGPLDHYDEDGNV